MAYKFVDSIQRGIIYLLKSDKDFYLQIINLVKAEYFEFDSHRLIFEVVVSHYDKYKVLPNDHVIVEQVKTHLTDKTKISDYEDELEWINNLDKTSLENRTYYLDLIERFAKKEAIKLAISKSIQLIKEDRFGDVEHEVKKALTISRDLDLGQNYFADVTDRWVRLTDNNSVNRFSTPFNELNKTMEGGPARKELCMVVAGSGRGKSIYLVNQGVKALTENRKVLYISLEMSEDRIAQRFDSVMSLIPQDKLKDNQDLLRKRLTTFKDAFPDSRLVIKEFPTGRANANTIRALINQIHNYEEFTPDVIIIDYLELLRPTTEGLAEYQAQERIAQELRGLGVEYNCIIWTASQPNREGARSTLITDTELADSYGKIRTCDLAISLNQTEQEYDQGVMRVYVMKSRNSKTRFTFPIAINYGTLEMKDYEGEYREEE